ncbi:MAG: hypothetical protein DRI01_00610 [Chloroflexi bacterium]|nr:MAG: hypothetical protein DRI01_00610 [Chloroflexota bacterium]
MESRTIEVPQELIDEVLKDEETILLKIVPDESTLDRLLKMVEKEDLVFGFNCRLAKEDVKDFLLGKANCIGCLIINKKLEDAMELSNS